MLKLSEIELLKEIRDWLKANYPSAKKEWVNNLEPLIDKYNRVIVKIQSKSKPLLEGEVYELKVVKGLSINQIIKEIHRRRGVKFSRSTIERAIRLENMVGKGKQAELYKQKVENANR